MADCLPVVCLCPRLSLSRSLALSVSHSLTLAASTTAAAHTHDTRAPAAACRLLQAASPASPASTTVPSSTDNDNDISSPPSPSSPSSPSSNYDDTDFSFERRGLLAAGVVARAAAPRTDASDGGVGADPMYEDALSSANAAPTSVGRCMLSVSKPVLKAPVVSALKN